MAAEVNVCFAAIVCIEKAGVHEAFPQLFI